VEISFEHRIVVQTNSCCKLLWLSDACSSEQAPGFSRGVWLTSIVVCIMMCAVCAEYGKEKRIGFFDNLSVKNRDFLTKHTEICSVVSAFFLWICTKMRYIDIEITRFCASHEKGEKL